MKASVSSPIITNLTKQELEAGVRPLVAKMLIQYGIETIPDDSRMFVLMEYIWDNVQNLTIEEISEANKLNLKEPENSRVSPFGAISCDFIGKIVSKYRERKMMAVKAYNAAKLKTVQPTFDRETPEQALNGLIEFYKREKAIPTGWNWSSCFDALYASGKAGSVETLKQWFDVTAKQVTAEVKAKVATAANLIEKRQLELQLQESNLKYEARRRFVQQWVIYNVEHD